MKIKQYIILRHEISPSLAVIGCSHGVLAAYLKWQNDPVVQDWISGKYGPFYKVICQARDAKEWTWIDTLGEHVKITESSVDNLCIAKVFKPIVWQKNSVFQDLNLYQG